MENVVEKKLNSKVSEEVFEPIEQHKAWHLPGQALTKHHAQWGLRVIRGGDRSGTLGRASSRSDGEHLGRHGSPPSRLEWGTVAIGRGVAHEQ